MSAEKKRIVLERTFDAPIADVWELWTTKDGLESWWGPEGFRVEVHELDLRVGGRLRYSMIAATPQMLAFMKQSGMPPSHEAHLRYTEIVPNERLAYLHAVDFVPGVAAYDVETRVELFVVERSVRVVLTLDAMHDAIWSGRMAEGWRQELEKLARVLEGRK